MTPRQIQTATALYRYRLQLLRPFHNTRNQEMTMLSSHKVFAEEYNHKFERVTKQKWHFSIP